LLVRRNWPGEVALIAQSLKEGLAPLRNHPAVKDVRVKGAIGVVELHQNVDVPSAQRAALEAGAWLRPFRNLIYTMPPYVVSPEELKQLITAVFAAVDRA
jgi:adenosylmethionine-8-amino-7-oxononanoate aminotransferase